MKTIKMEIIDYDKVLTRPMKAFIELYKVANDKKLVDQAFALYLKTLRPAHVCSVTHPIGSEII